MFTQLFTGDNAPITDPVFQEANQPVLADLIEERPDGMVIRGLEQGGENGRLKPAGKPQSHGDHRVAMSLAIGGLTAEQIMTIADTGCVNTSFPNFEEALVSLFAHPA